MFCVFELPPLKDRAQDIPLLVAHFVDNASKQVKQTPPQITDEALSVLIGFHWPGNIRQLENVIFRLIALSDGHAISAKQVNEVLFDHQESSSMAPIEQEQVEDWASAQSMFEKQLLERLYPFYPTTRKLAERLNVSHNKIAMKLRQYGFKKQ